MLKNKIIIIGHCFVGSVMAKIEESLEKGDVVIVEQAAIEKEIKEEQEIKVVISRRAEINLPVIHPAQYFPERNVIPNKYYRESKRNNYKFNKNPRRR